MADDSKRREDDTIRRTMVDSMEHAASDIPDAVQRIVDAAESVRKEGRLLRMESRKVRNSRPGLLRPEIKTGGGSK